MFLRLTADHPPELADVYDFTAFKLVRGTGADVESVGRRDGADVFVRRDVLVTAGPSDDPGWVAGLDDMIASVRRFGWVDADGSVRAHVEEQ